MYSRFEKFTTSIYIKYINNEYGRAQNVIHENVKKHPQSNCPNYKDKTKKKMMKKISIQSLGLYASKHQKRGLSRPNSFFS